MHHVLNGEMKPLIISVVGSAFLKGASNLLVVDQLQSSVFCFLSSKWFDKERVLTMKDLLHLIQSTLK